MSWIYDLSDGRKACLYTERNRIMFHAFPSRNGGMPAVAKDDHESGLTAAMYYGTIYFSYISTGGELIFDGIGSGEEISLGSAEGIKAGPDLAAAAGNLLLFCLRRGEEGNMMRLEAVDPYRAGRPWIVAEGKGLSGYRVIRQQNSVLVLVFCGNEIEEEKVWKDGRFCQTTQIRYRQEMSRLEKEYSVLKRRMQEQERSRGICWKWKDTGTVNWRIRWKNTGKRYAMQNRSTMNSPALRAGFRLQ